MRKRWALQNKKLPPAGTVVHQLEGVELGPKGATILNSSPGHLKVHLLDEDRTVDLKTPADLSWSGEDKQPKEEGLGDSFVDESAIGYGPASKQITRLPLWWGPADPNHPSSMSDVTWRPEQWEQRYLRRYYQRQVEQALVEWKRGTRRYANPDVLAAAVAVILPKVEADLQEDIRNHEDVASPYLTAQAEAREYLERACTSEQLQALANVLDVPLSAEDLSRFRFFTSKETVALTEELAKEVLYHWRQARKRDASVKRQHGTKRRGADMKKRRAGLTDQDATKLCNEVYEQCGTDRECYEIADGFRKRDLDYRTDAADFISQQCSMRGAGMKKRQAVPFDLVAEMRDNYRAVDHLGKFFDLRGPQGVALGKYPTVGEVIRAAKRHAGDDFTGYEKIYVMTDAGVDLYGLDGLHRKSWSSEEFLPRRGSAQKPHHEGSVQKQAIISAEQDRVLDLTKWDGEGADQDTDLLRDLALQFCHDYDDLVIKWHPTMGRGWETSPSEFMLVWGPDMELTKPEQEELWRFMVATGLYADTEYQAWKRLQSSDQILRSDIPRVAKKASAPKQASLRLANRLISDLVSKLKLRPATAAKIARAAHKAHTPEEVDAAMDLTNQLINGYGVEALDAEPDYDYNAGGYYRGVVALYVNVLDPFVPTLIYDTENEIFLVAGWGDFLESWEQEHPEEARWNEERNDSRADRNAGRKSLPRMAGLSE